MSAVQQLPLVPEPPHDPTLFVLAGTIGPDARIGFKVGQKMGGKGGLDKVRIAQAGDCSCLVLAPGVAGARRWDEAYGSFGGLRLPANVAVAESGDIYLLDRTRGVLLRFDPCACEFREVSCHGSSARAHDEAWFVGATALAICHGDLFVANPRLGRVLRIALNGLLMRAALRVPRRGQGSLQPGLTWRPSALAIDGAGRLWVGDSTNGRIDRFGPDGKWIEPGWPGLVSPRHLAVDCNDRLYVLTEGDPAVANTFDAGTLTPVAGDPPDFAATFPSLPFPVDSAAQLHLGALCSDLCGRTGIFDLNGMPVVRDAAAKLPLYLTTGGYTSAPLDSRIERCQWHRVVLEGVVPENTSVEVQTTTAHIVFSPDELTALPDEAWQTRTQWVGARERQPESALCDIEARAPRTSPPYWDCLVRSAPARFCWLRLILRSDGSATPGIRRIVVEYPRISLRRYLPAVFGAEPVSADFTDRFLSIFDTTLRSIERHLDRQAALFDPMTAPATRGRGQLVDFLSWLGAWIGIALDRHWPEERRRRFLKDAPSFFALRGTRAGLWRALLSYLGMSGPACCAHPQKLTRCVPRAPNCEPAVTPDCEWERPPLILEHFKLRRWLHVGKGRLGDESVLWGRSIVNRSQLGTNAQVGVTQLKALPDPARDPFLVDAHRFTVFAPARVRASPEERKGLENLLRTEAPAHTLYDIRYVEPRFRVGVQAVLGYDAVIARTPQGVRLGDAQLRRATVLGPSPRMRNGPSLVVGAQARVGTTTKLT